MTLQETKLLHPPVDGADSGCGKWAAVYLLYLWSFTSPLQILPSIYIISFNIERWLFYPLALTDHVKTDVKSACVYMGALNITSYA